MLNLMSDSFLVAIEPALAEDWSKDVEDAWKALFRFLFYAMCFMDCGLHNQNIDVIILFACLVGWPNSSPVKIKKRLRHDL